MTILGLQKMQDLTPLDKNEHFLKDGIMGTGARRSVRYVHDSLSLFYTTYMKNSPNKTGLIRYFTVAQGSLTNNRHNKIPAAM
jgi:hypothetical protein